MSLFCMLCKVVVAGSTNKRESLLAKTSGMRAGCSRCVQAHNAPMRSLVQEVAIHEVGHNMSSSLS